MRRIATLFLVLAGGVIASLAQDAVLIIDEDFQTWPATEGVKSDPPDSCENSIPSITGADLYDLPYETGGSGQVKLIKYAISPECNTKRVNQGEAAQNAIDVTTGWVRLDKLNSETDSIGEMWLPKLTNVTDIEFGYSCTSSDRGVRLYTSTDNGETWEGPWTADGPGVGEIIGSDTKLGEMVELSLNRDNVIIKFTSGVDYDGNTQYSRIHNIKVWGVPGGPETGLEQVSPPTVLAHYVQGTGLVIKGEVIYFGIYDLHGRLVYESYQGGDQVVDLSDHPDGTYVLTMEDTDHQVRNTKFVKY
jgi:hypothetical protein